MRRASSLGDALKLRQGIGPARLLVQQLDVERNCWCCSWHRRWRDGRLFDGPSGQPLAARTFAQRSLCALAMLLRPAADSLRLFPRRTGAEFAENSRSAEITFSSFFSSFRVWERSILNVLIISVISMAGIWSPGSSANFGRVYHNTRSV